MNQFRFLDFHVYQESKVLHKLTVNVTKNFPRDFQYLKDQLRRAALSVVLNIAEGSAKRTDKDFRRYIDNSLGSVTELAAGLDIAYNLQLISESQLQELLKQALSVKLQLGGFAKKLVVGG